MFNYRQLQKVFHYLNRFSGKKLHNFKMLDEPDFWEVEDECEEEDDGKSKHSPDSHILNYEDVVVIPLESTGREFSFDLKMYSKKPVGFVFFISYNPDVFDNEDLHEKFAKTSYVWDDGVSGYLLMQYSTPTEGGEMKDDEVTEIFKKSLQEVMNEIENILK